MSDEKSKAIDKALEKLTLTGAAASTTLIAATFAPAPAAIGLGAFAAAWLDTQIKNHRDKQRSKLETWAKTVFSDPFKTEEDLVAELEASGVDAQRVVMDSIRATLDSMDDGAVVPLATLARLYLNPPRPPDPVPPDDAQPCGGSCGAGTACVAGQCVTVDSGTPGPDVVGVDTGNDSGQVTDAPASDTGQDASAPTDTGCPSGQVVCNPAVPRCVDLQRGEQRDGSVAYCGECGRSCGAGLFCERGACAR